MMNSKSEKITFLIFLWRYKFYTKSYSRDLVEDKKVGFEDEIERWIKEEILVPWEGEVEGYLAFMAVEQPLRIKLGLAGTKGS